MRRISILFDRRCYSFAKTTNKLTPYWLTLKLKQKNEDFATNQVWKKQQKFIEEALQGKWQFCTVEMVNKTENGTHISCLRRKLNFTSQKLLLV